MDSSNNFRSIFLIIISTALGAFFGVIIKDLFSELNVTTIGFYRFFFGLILISPLIVKNNFDVLKTSNLKLYFFRSSLNILGFLLNFTALGLLTLEKNAALGFMSPLYATVLAIIILKEKIRLYRTTALIIGLIGVLIVIQPGLSGIEIGIIFAIIGQFCFGLTIIIIKMTSKKDSSLTILSYQYLLTSLFALLIYIPLLEVPNTEQFIKLLIAAIIGTLMHYTFNQAIKISDVTFITPFKYMGLVFASLLGFIFFRDVPNIYTWIGGSIIFLSVLIITIREKQLNKDIAKKSVINLM